MTTRRPFSRFIPTARLREMFAAKDTARLHREMRTLRTQLPVAPGDRLIPRMIAVIRRELRQRGRSS